MPGQFYSPPEHQPAPPAKEREHRGVANPEAAKARHGLRSSSATSPHRLAWCKGTRAERVRRVLREQEG